MNRLKSLHTMPILLAALNAAFLVAVFMVWRVGQRHIHEPEHLAVRAVSLPDLGALNVSTLADVNAAEIRDNAVFYSRRSFYEPPVPSQILPVPDYDFAGSMALPRDKRVAFVKRKSDHVSRTLHVGDDLDGWRVGGIEASKVVLLREDQRVELASTGNAPASGVVHGTFAPRMAQSALHTLGGQGSSSAPATRESAPRIYHPPP
jgi:hypothetical protein